MAKRKRLTPAQPDALNLVPAGLETKSIGFPRTPAPIAQVAGDASTAAALEELAGEMRRARDEGRMIQDLDLDQVDETYLVRDRILADDDEMAALLASIRSRGQQTPIEVVALGDARYGLISGWRRLTALRRLLDESGEARFAKVRAVLRRPDTAAEAYLAMVEENEIRVGLSYYERARVAAKAVEQGVYDNARHALQDLFAAASRAKRSKIGSFLILVRELDEALRFPAAIPERLGAALAKALEAAPGRAQDLRDALAAAAPRTAEAEQGVLSAWLKSSGRKQTRNGGSESKQVRDSKPERVMPQGLERVSEGIQMTYSGHRLVLSGAGVTEAFRRRLRAWLETQG